MSNPSTLPLSSWRTYCYTSDNVCLSIQHCYTSDNVCLTFQHCHYPPRRQNLEKLYLVYIRPIFEYACEVWDNCGVGNSNKLDHLQLEAARIVTGLPIFASSILIYKELGWESLAERRKRRKLQMFYNIQNNNAPMYLCDLIPPSIQSTTVYPLRNGSDIIMPFCRLSNTYDSFIPSTIRHV